MKNKIVKGVTALVFFLFAVVIAFLMVRDFQAGIETAGQKGYFALYIALLIYALWRVIILVRDIFRK
jgi:hypothetical protein